MADEFEKLKLEIEKQKLEIEKSKSKWTALSVGFPILATAITVTVNPLNTDFTLCVSSVIGLA